MRRPESGWVSALVGLVCLIGGVFFQSVPMAIIFGAMVIAREIEVKKIKVSQ